MKPENKNHIIYSEQYAIPVAKKQDPTNNMAQYQRYINPHPNKNQQLYNIQKVQNVQNIQKIPQAQNPQPTYKNPNTLYSQNIPFTNINRKTHNPSQLRHGQLKNQFFGIEETYVIDPNTGKKIILETKNVPNDNNQGHIGNNQGHIGNNQGHIGNNQVHIGINQGHIGNNQVHIDNNQAHIGNNQADINNNQVHTGINQGHIGNNQVYINNNQTYNTQFTQNEVNYMNPEEKTISHQTRAYQQQDNDHNNNDFAITYEPQPQITNDSINTINPTTSIYTDIYASTEIKTTQPTQPKKQNDNNEENQSPIIEDLNRKESNVVDLPLDPKKSATLMTVNSLANIHYNAYPTAHFSKEPFLNIAGYGFNSYNGKVKKFNEDRIKTIVNYQLVNKENIKVKPNISYFSIFDGHSGNKCSDFLKQYLHLYLFNSSFFPNEPIKAIREAFKKAEDNFCGMVYDPNSNILLDKSGSCALVMLIINDVLFSINLGDSRALYSYDTGNFKYQITRDHKPNDDVERKRIENAGGSVFYANKIQRNGREIELKEEQFGKGFSFPYRISPGKIAVSLIYNNLGRKNYWRLLC